MTLIIDIQKERKKLLVLLAEASSKHKELDTNHSLGVDSECKLCILFNQMKASDELLKDKMVMVQQDNRLIHEFNTLRDNLGHIPDEAEFQYSKEAVERFGSWHKFLIKSLQ